MGNVSSAKMSDWVFGRTHRKLSDTKDIKDIKDTKDTKETKKPKETTNTKLTSKHDTVFYLGWKD